MNEENCCILFASVCNGTVFVRTHGLETAIVTLTH